jgi:hypothetical protein
MRYRPVTRSIVALITSLGLIACGGTAEDAQPSDRSADESAVDQGQEAEPEEDPSDADSDAEVDADPAGEDDDTSRPADSDLVAEGVSWTVLIYLMGDNDLEPYAVGDMFEMAEAGSNENVNIVTLVDRHPGYSDDEIGPLGNFDGTTLVHVGREEVITAFDSGELNLGDPETLKSFLVTGVTEFPADRYALILWDHGGGWTGMGPDDTDGEDILTLPEIRSGVADGLAEVGLDSIDLLGFDACLMATFEVATQVQDLADVMVASEELEPGHGWDFASLEILRDRRDVGAVGLAVELIDTYAAQAAEAETGINITLSALDLTAIAELEEALDDLAEVLAEGDPSVIAAFAAARQAALAFGANPDPSLATNLVDLGSLMEEFLMMGTSVGPEIEAVRAALQAVVIHEVSGPATRRATGVSVYFPPSADYVEDEYADLGEVPGWFGILEAFYFAGDNLDEASKASFAEDDALEFYFDDEGLTVSGTVDVGSSDPVIAAEIVYGVVDDSDGSVIFIGEEPASFEALDDGSGEVAAFYDLTVLTLSDGIDTDFAYLDMEIDDESGLWFLDVPLWYVPPEETDTDDPPHDVILGLTLNPDGDVLSEVYYEINADGMIGELTADPDGLIYPVVLNQYADGSSEWLTLSEVGLYADLPSLQYDVVPLESGTELVVELVVYDYSGDSSSQTGVITLP